MVLKNVQIIQELTPPPADEPEPPTEKLKTEAEHKTTVMQMTYHQSSPSRGPNSDHLGAPVGCKTRELTQGGATFANNLHKSEPTEQEAQVQDEVQNQTSSD